MSNLALLSLSGDLKRICQSIQRNSPESSKRFQQEAGKWLKAAKRSKDKSVMGLLVKVAQILKKEDNLVKAEECLTYSVILQDLAVYQKSAP